MSGATDIIRGLMAVVDMKDPVQSRPAHKALRHLSDRNWDAAAESLMDTARVSKGAERFVNELGHGHVSVDHLARVLRHRYVGRGDGPRLPVEPPPEVGPNDLLRIQNKLNWTSEELGIHLGVRRGTVTNYRAGRSTIDGATARCLLDLERRVDGSE